MRADDVSLLGQLVDPRHLGAAVVAGENDQRVIGHAVPFERLADLDHHRVGLHDEITVVTQPALALPLRSGHDRRVR